MPYTPQPIDPYALFNEITADPYLSSPPPLPPAPQANQIVPQEPSFSSPPPPQKRYPKFSSPATNHTPLLSTLRRHLVAILRARIPLTNDDIANPILSEAFSGPLTRRVWKLVWELVDAEGGGEEGREGMEGLKRALVREVVGCIVWDGGMDGAWEAGRVVENLWPAGRWGE